MNKYNEPGKLAEKNLYMENGTPHESIDYRYNIHGWRQSVNTNDANIDLKLMYNNPPHSLFGISPNFWGGHELRHMYLVLFCKKAIGKSSW